MHTLDWFISRIGKTLKRTRIDLGTGTPIISYVHLRGERQAKECFMTQDRWNDYQENVPIKHRY